VIFFLNVARGKQIALVKLVVQTERSRRLPMSANFKFLIAFAALIGFVLGTMTIGASEISVEVTPRTRKRFSTMIEWA
jgi:hypothetical protein